MTSPLLPAALTATGYFAALLITRLAASRVLRSGTFHQLAHRFGPAFGQVFLALHVAYALFAWWASRIGRNDRTFGLGLVLAATYPWYLIFWFLAASGGDGVSLIFAVLAVGAWLYTWLGPYRRFVTRVWGATGYRRDLALLGWLPGLLTVPLRLLRIDASLLMVNVQVAFFFTAMVTATVVQHLRSKDSSRTPEVRTVIGATVASIALFAALSAAIRAVH